MDGGGALDGWDKKGIYKGLEQGWEEVDKGRWRGGGEGE